MRTILLLCLCLATPAWTDSGISAADPIPAARWDHRDESDRWSRAVLQALKAHGEPLIDTAPEDIARWCPGYVNAPPESRRAFWVGFLSALSKYESTHKPGAVGGDGKWFGLLQIAPATARGHDCKAGSGEALKDGADNLSCAIRIMATTVGRDGVIHASEPEWSGVSADWGPMRSALKRQEMRNWLHAQEYCQMHASLVPRARPARDEATGRTASRSRSTPQSDLALLTPRFTEDRPF